MPPKGRLYRKDKNSNNKAFQIFRNPLMQTFGILIQRLRNLRGLSSEDVAQMLGLAQSSYRMIEAGSAILQTSRAIAILRLFDKIEFNPLCKLLVAIQVMSSGSKTIEDMHTQALSLSDADSQIKALLEYFEPIWEMMQTETPAKVTQTIKLHQLDIVLEKFLTSSTHLSATGMDEESSKDDYLDKTLKSLKASTSPIYTEVAIDLLKNLQGLVPHLTPDEMSKWERRHRYEITQVFALVKDSGSLTDPSNFKMYDYLYLWNPMFQELKALYLTDEPAEKILEEFKQNLRMHFERYRKRYQAELELFNHAIKKINFKCAFSQKEAGMAILKQHQPQTVSMWFNILKSGNIVTFADNIGIHKYYESIENDLLSDRYYYETILQHGKSMQSLEEYQKIWNTLS